ncbi:MAG TPA: hypothetical protein VNG53_11380 [Bacteroidia bacterium]|nr:hypothetical protein [Bacteroidia bacterium]
MLHEQNRVAFLSVAQKNNFSKFTTIILSDTEINNPSVFQKKDKGEFLYKGKMYDIVSQQKTKNGISFYCYNDEKDSQLAVALERDVNNFVHPNKNNTQKNNFLNSFFSKLYCNNHFNLNLTIVTKNLIEKTFFEHTYQSPHGKVPVPPPKNFLV